MSLFTFYKDDAKQYEPPQDGRNQRWFGMGVVGSTRQHGTMKPHATIFGQKYDKAHFLAHEHHTEAESQVTEDLLALLGDMRYKVYDAELDTVGIGGTALRIVCPELIEDLYAVRAKLDSKEWDAKGVQWMGGIFNTHLTITISAQWDAVDGPRTWIFRHVNRVCTDEKLRYSLAFGAPIDGFGDRGRQGDDRTSRQVPLQQLCRGVHVREMAELRKLKEAIPAAYYLEQAGRVGKIEQRLKHIMCCAMPYVCFRCDATVTAIAGGPEEEPVRKPGEALWIPQNCLKCQTTTTTTTTATTTTTTTATATTTTATDSNQETKTKEGDDC